MRITEKLLRKHPRPTTGQSFSWDDLLEGYGVRFTPTMTSYVVQWREADGSRPRDTLEIDGRPARWPAVTPEVARDLARAKLSRHVGQRPGEGQRMTTAIRTWFDRVSGDWRPRYRDKVASIISTYVEGAATPRVELTPAARAAVKAIGASPVSAVHRSDVMAVADAIKPGAAEQFMAVLSSFFGWAYERGWSENNPARNRLRVTGGRRVRQRRLSDKEFVALWRAFEAEGDPHFAAFQLLALTGARRREVTEMRRSEIDLDAGTWTLPPERRKTGKRDPEPFVIVLAPAAIAALKRQPVLEGSPFVFWGRRDRRPFDFQHAVTGRVQASAGVKDWRLHDLRRYMRSGLAALGVSQVVAELTLGHRTPLSGLTGVYDVHTYADEKHAAWLKWAQHVARLTR